MQTLINQKKIEAEKMQAKLLWKKYASAIMLCVATIISCALTIHELISSGIIKIPGSPDDKAKSGLTFSLDDAVLIGAVGILLIIFITCLSLYIKQKYEIKKFKSDNDLVKFVRDYGDLDKIKSFLSETIELRNSSIAIKVFSEIVLKAMKQALRQENYGGTYINQLLQATQSNMQQFIDHIRPMIPTVPVSETKNYEQLSSILEKVNSLLIHYTESDQRQLSYYTSHLEQTSFKPIYKLFDQKDDKKDHVKILNEAYEYVKKNNNILDKINTKKQKIKDEVFFKTKKKDDLYHVFEAISQSMMLEHRITSQNENGNSTEVVQKHLADAHHLAAEGTDNIYKDVISYLDKLNSTPCDYNDLADNLNDILKPLTEKAPGNIEYITEKFNSPISKRFELMANTILDRDTSKIEIQELHKKIESINNSAYPGVQGSSSTDQITKLDKESLTMDLAKRLLNDEIELAKVHNTTLDLSKESVIFSCLKDELSKQLKTRLEDMVRKQQQQGSSQHPDHHGSMQDVSSMTSAKSIQTLQKDTQHKK